METLTTAAGGSELFLEGAGVGLGFGIVLARLIHGGVGQTHDYSSDRAKHPRRFGCAHTALVLMEGDVQTMVEPAFNDPVAALEPQHPPELAARPGSDCSTDKRPPGTICPYAGSASPSGPPAARPGNPPDWA